ncbi:MAG: ArsC/Spx/MgsR family protein [Hyphomonadaceae bacterium]|nr:ArsC/Spx/MgsR family protein [Hyphomonadaceae bacterium]
MAKQTSKVVIWHNPSCGSSRNALEHLRAKGIEPDIYLYLKARPKRAEIEAVLKRLKATPAELLRPKQPEGEAAGVYAPGVSGDAILAAMEREPILIQRPIVITEKGAVIARPKDKIDALL